MNKAEKTEPVIIRICVETMRRVRGIAKVEERTIAKTLNRLLVEAINKRGEK